jgi:antitoxin (DNA-binding transcriptional repressor) of toxin-antitoxin stability system
MQIQVDELAIDAKKLLKAIQYGEPILLMYQDKPQAKIVKLTTTETTPQHDLSQSPLFGIWQDKEDCQDVQAYVDNFRQGRFSC